jgi:hypothetical protein
MPRLTGNLRRNLRRPASAIGALRGSAAIQKLRRHAAPTALALAILASLAGTGSPLADAAEQTILGSLLTMRDPGTATGRSVNAAAVERDSGNTVVGSPLTGGGVLEILANGASPSGQTFTLPQGTNSAGKPYWTAVGTRGYQYRDPRGENGPVKSAQIQKTSSGSLVLRASVSAKNGDVDVAPPAPGSDGCVALTLSGGDRYSVKFGADGTVKNNGALSFSVRKPASEGVCAAAPTPTPSPVPTPTPDCAAGNFLDVSGAAGPSYNGLMPSLGASCGTSTVTVQSNGIPTYQFIALTPNGLQAKSYTFTFPRYPQVAANVTAVPLLGNVGVSVAGMPIFGVSEGPQPVSEAYGNPIAAAILDDCGSHSAQQGTFHNHALQVKCLTQSAVSKSQPWNDPDPSPDEPSPIVGYAFDGFPIYGPYECTDASCTSVRRMLSGWDDTGHEAGTEGCSSSAACSSGYCTEVMIDGAETTACVPKTCVWSNNAYVAKASTDYLDQCNGHTGPNGDYHYHTTSTFPYIISCYRGTPTNNGGNGTPPGPSCS